MVLKRFNFSTPTRRVDLIFGLLALIIIGGGLFYIERERSHVPIPLEYEGTPYLIEGGVARRGQQLITTIKRCNESGDPIVYTFSRAAYREELRDREAASGFSLASGIAVLRPGCETSEHADLGIVPQNAQPGRYIVRTAAIVTMRGRAFFASWESQPFDVE